MFELDSISMYIYIYMKKKIYIYIYICKHFFSLLEILATVCVFVARGFFSTPIKRKKEKERISFSLKLTFSHLKMDGWKIEFPFGARPIFRGGVVV